MTYEEFLTFIPTKCMYEANYTDSNGRDILVIRMLDAYGMINKAQRKWQGLTDEERDSVLDSVPANNMGGEYYSEEITEIAKAIEAKLQLKNR
jgi:hypothetical protein